jgi:Raf kinase inhibitor-like YbhB/YbcL family protein
MARSIRVNRSLSPTASHDEPLLSVQEGTAASTTHWMASSRAKCHKSSVRCCQFLNSTNTLVRSVLVLCTVSFMLFGCSLFITNERREFMRTTLSNLRGSTDRSFQITSQAFAYNQSIPSKYSKTYSPPLEWKYQPVETQSYALIVEDIDTIVPFRHLILYNIPVTTNKLSEGMLLWPTGTLVVRNDYGYYRYDGPHPKDGRLHHYRFRLVALNVSQLVLPTGTGHVASHDDLITTMTPYIIQEANLFGTYHPLKHD